MAKNVYNWLAQGIQESEKALGVLPQAEIDKRVTALREMFEAPTPTQFEEAQTIAHFPLYFATALSREFVKAYETYPGSWKNYTYADTAVDFRPMERLRMDRYFRLRLRREKAEAKTGYLSENHYTYSVDEYADQYDVSWQTLLNDDLAEIKKAPQLMAQAAAEFEDEFVSNLYDNATSIVAWAAPTWPWSGTGRLTGANLAIGINAMLVRTTPEGRPMNIRKIYLVIPPLLAYQARVILASALMPGFAVNDKNLLSDYIAGVYTDPYITTATPNVPWYLFADPNEIRGVPVGRLQGAPGPLTYMEQPSTKILSGSAPANFELGSFMTGDVQYGVSTFIGGVEDGTWAGVADFRGLYYSNGTTA